jgi:16S rRNA (cytidine1402-2'-O)-methyltransferase
MLGKMYIIATPIGNLEDITLRAIRMLTDADIILAEDTRVTKKLLDKYNIKYITKNIGKEKKKQHTKYNIQHKQSLPFRGRTDKKEDANYSLPTTHYPQLISYHQHSSEKRKLEILRYILEGKNVALVSDAGTPGISDPGNELVDFILEKEPKVNIVPIPGVSAVTTALSVSGFKSNKFIFLGYFPRKKRKKLIELIELAGLPIVFFESPHRILKTLEFVKESLGKDKRILVARELTKMHESLYRGKIEEVLKILSTNRKVGKNIVKGEIVVVVDI